jgi:hypothetical protein
MNQYLFLHRIQGPAMLLTFGFCALLNEWHVLSFGKSWPLYLIVLGLLKLAQRAALANAEPPAYPGYGPSYGPGYAPAGAPPQPPATTALVPTDSSINPPDSGERR